jgi:hypothetical protein
VDWILELAENANAHTPLRPEDERIVTDRYVLWMGRGERWNVAQRFRFEADELDEVRAEIHGHVRARGRSACSWEVGSHATPRDLVERLRTLGLRGDEPDDYAVGMVLDEPPPFEIPPGLEVRRAETLDDYRDAERIATIAFGGGAAGDEVPVQRDPDGLATYVVVADGRPIARATAAFSEHGVTLFGGATLPDARGRGAYRALVGARWADAVAAGTPLLVTQAGKMSRPILRRLGFREVCEIWMLVDDFGG